MSNLFLVILCLVTGWLLRRSGRVPANAAATMNGIVILVALPAAALLYLHGLAFEWAMLLPVLMAWILFILGALFFLVLGRAFGWSPGLIGCLILTGALSNTSFVGFPLLTALYGPESLRIGILTDQPGSFMVLSTLGLLTASLCASGNFSPTVALKRILGFPPFYAMILALVLTPFQYPAAVKEILEKLAALLVPVSLLSVGFQLNLRVDHVRNFIPQLTAGLVYKLLIGPAMIALLFVWALGSHGQTIEITIVQAAMAPMITGAILADEYGLEPDLANLMVGIGIPVSLITVPVWAWFLRGI